MKDIYWNWNWNKKFILFYYENMIYELRTLWFYSKYNINKQIYFVTFLLRLWMLYLYLLLQHGHGGGNSQPGQFRCKLKYIFDLVIFKNDIIEVTIQYCCYIKRFYGAGFGILPQKIILSKCQNININVFSILQTTSSHCLPSHSYPFLPLPIKILLPLYKVINLEKNLNFKHILF